MTWWWWWWWWWCAIIATVPTTTSIERPAVSNNERRGDFILFVCDRSTTGEAVLGANEWSRWRERRDSLEREIVHHDHDGGCWCMMCGAEKRAHQYFPPYLSWQCRRTDDALFPAIIWILCCDDQTIDRPRIRVRSWSKTSRPSPRQDRQDPVLSCRPGLARLSRLYLPVNTVLCKVQ